jgi:hypothetical protein
VTLRCCYLHIMKTAGFTTTRQLGNAFPPEAAWGFTPNDEDWFTRVNTYINPRLLANTPREDRARYSLFCGHFPFAVTELLEPDTVTITVVREPISRVISHLQHCQRTHVEHHGLRLDEIYEDPWFAPRFFHDHMVKMLAMPLQDALAHPEVDGWDKADMELLNRWRDDERLVSREDRRWLFRSLYENAPARIMYELMGAPNTGGVTVDDATTTRAVSNLERLDIVGVHDRYADFTAEVSSRLSIPMRADIAVNVGGEVHISNWLRRRIAEDNTADQALYEAAQRLAGQRA